MNDLVPSRAVSTPLPHAGLLPVLRPQASWSARERALFGLDGSLVQRGRDAGFDSRKWFVQMSGPVWQREAGLQTYVGWAQMGSCGLPLSVLRLLPLLTLQPVDAWLGAQWGHLIHDWSAPAGGPLDKSLLGWARMQEEGGDLVRAVIPLPTQARELLGLMHTDPSRELLRRMRTDPSRWRVGRRCSQEGDLIFCEREWAGMTFMAPHFWKQAQGVERYALGLALRMCEYFSREERRALLKVCSTWRRPEGGLDKGRLHVGSPGCVPDACAAQAMQRWADYVWSVAQPSQRGQSAVKQAPAVA